MKQCEQKWNFKRNTSINLLSYSMSIARMDLFEILVELGSAQALLFKAILFIFKSTRNGHVKYTWLKMAYQKAASLWFLWCVDRISRAHRWQQLNVFILIEFVRIMEITLQLFVLNRIEPNKETNSMHSIGVSFIH